MVKLHKLNRGLITAFGSYEEGKDQEDMDVHANDHKEEGDVEAYDTEDYRHDGEVSDETEASTDELLEGFHEAGLGRASEYDEQDETYDSDEEVEEEFGVEDSELS